jgi:hypothetical protein
MVDNDYIDHLKDANIFGFVKITNAIPAYGVI